jgi:DNA mismatch repair ATPase MutS
MAGKSTFLRAVGVNVILGLAGSVVCANRMVCPLIEVYSGMRNTDSINENQSYFYAELLRLHNIIEKLRNGTPLLILLDEILKGTNSIDKLNGSEELLKQLTTMPCMAMIATHDVALGEMANAFAQIRNYHFETTIKEGELFFDYQLRKGVSTGKNATFLMRKMGIIPS